MLENDGFTHGTSCPHMSTRVGLFHKIRSRSKPQIGLYERPYLQICIVNLGENVFNKDLFEVLNENLFYGTALDSPAYQAPPCQVYIISPLEKRFSFLFFPSLLSLSLMFSFRHSLVSPIKVDCEKVLCGDAGSPRKRIVVLHARGRDERRRRVKEGRVRASAYHFAVS